jgi:leucyl/phenylalanyl-tRNA--protein transferase
MPIGDGRSLGIGWWSPDPRGVIPIDGLIISRSLRKARQNFEIRTDTAFVEVVRACADPRREGAWINDAIAAAYAELHALGWAHSVEAWSLDTGELAGGLYGVAVGGLFRRLESRAVRAGGAAANRRWAAVGLPVADASSRQPRLRQYETRRLPRSPGDRSESAAVAARLALIPIILMCLVNNCGVSLG